MSQKAPKEQIPSLIAELVNRTANIETITLLTNFLSTVHVSGREATGNLNRCFAWLEGVSKGETMRIADLKALLPDQDTEIKFGPEEGEQTAAEGADVAKPAVSQGGVEMQKGEPVLGAV